MQDFLRAYAYLFAALTILDELKMHLPAADVAHSLDRLERSEIGQRCRETLEEIKRGGDQNKAS